MPGSSSIGLSSMSPSPPNLLERLEMGLQRELRRKQETNFPRACVIDARRKRCLVKEAEEISLGKVRGKESQSLDP